MAEPSTIFLENFKYELPDSRIARYPLPDRSASKLLLYKGENISQTRFSHLPEHLPADSWLVFNNTRVIQARLIFRKESGARIEIFCLEPCDPADYQLAFLAKHSATWHCLVGNVKKWKSGPVSLETGIRGRVVMLEAHLLERHGEGFLVQFRWQDPEITFGEIIEQSGSTPIPPYMKREAEESDRERYQTVYSVNNGSVAAPTAGLHFSGELIRQLESRRILMEHITLHVGAGTFVPVKEKNARDHSMHSELVVVTRKFLKRWLKRTRGLVAVGTTSTRSLESLYWLGVKFLVGPQSDPFSLSLAQWDHEQLPQEISLPESLEAVIAYCKLHNLEQLHFTTNLMIVPGYRFRTIEGLITNFHMPGSTLLLLIAAWIGEDWRKVYDYALKENFRFLSYGDSSLLIPPFEQ
ncbi:MAG: S-adenosylmethionine:tRNA ribosyltransferase-isomerase [Bacteroidales bacterium]|nr:S-adenosylmethionine:tRNA ribosyltransferase-isomerase [Bacteroidales bacterium]